MFNINKTHKFTSAGQRQLENEVSMVSVKDGKLKIEYQTRGGAKSFASTESTINLTNTSYDAQRLKDYKIAYDIRKNKLGFTDSNAKRKYPVPTEPSSISMGSAAKKAKAEYEKYNKLDQATKDAYEKVQFAEEYKEPEKVKAIGKIYYDFFENPARTQLLEEFKQLLETFISSNKDMPEIDFNNQKKQSKQIKSSGRNKELINNPQYIETFHKPLDEIANIVKSGNFFNTTSKTAPNAANEPPLIESFKYDLTSEDYGSAGEQITTLKNFNKANSSIKTIKTMLSVLNTVEKIREEKEKAEAVEKSSFVKIPDVIAELNNVNKIQQGDLVSVKNLLEITDSKLKLDTEQNKFCLYKSDGTIIPIYQVITIINQFPSTLPVCPTDASSLNKLIAENQMHRIRDGRAAATKMTLMHLVTGQGIKHYMVEETIKLCKTLYESTNLDLSV